MSETKTVIQGGHGPVPMEENTRRYIDQEPVEVPMTAYYARRLMSGELVEVAVTTVEHVEPVTAKHTPWPAPDPFKGGEG